MNTNHVHTILARILMVSTLVTIIGLTGLIIFLWMSQRHSFQQDIARNKVTLLQSYNNTIERDTNNFHTILQILAQNKKIQQAWISKNRSLLLNTVAPIFKEMQKTQNITHFHFHNKNGINFLRLHAPDVFGDKIQRATLQAAMDSGQFNSGIEFGYKGQLVLRTVLPIKIDNKIQGYIELGKQMSHISEEIANVLDINLIMAIDKDYIATDWHNVSTDKFQSSQPPKENYLIITKTRNLKPEKKLLEYIENKHRLSSLQFKSNGKNYFAAIVSIKNTNHFDQGLLVLIKDISQQRENQIVLYTILGIICALWGLALFLAYLSLRKQIQKDLFKSYQLMNTEVYKSLFDSTSDAVLIIEDNNFIDCNKAAMDMLGYTYDKKQELLNTHPSELSPEIQPDGRKSREKAEEMIAIAFKKGGHRFEWDHKKKNNQVFPVEVVLTCIPIGGRNFLHVVWRDISERKQAEAKIYFQANYDSLTRLPNRQLFMDRLDQAIYSSRENNACHALLFLDLDRFKSINDSLGHHIGDKLLIEVSNRIRNKLREQDTAARLGGDEFVILLTFLHPGLRSASRIASNMSTAFLDLFQDVFKINQYELKITTSIGIKLIYGKNENKDDVLKHADIAMYHSKENGRNQISIYSSRMHEKITTRLILENDLKKALQNKELTIYYQPILNSDGKTCKVEALIRWPHKQKGMIPPDLFIPVAEQTGLIHELGLFVMNQAITEVLQTNAKYKTDLGLSINISPQQFKNEKFIAETEQYLKNINLPANFLTMELTENILIDNIDKIQRKISRLKQIGIKISLDDFGTGYSSLGYLKTLPIDELKIDRNFVLDLQDDQNSFVLVKTIISIAKQFSLQIVAEGIEQNHHEEFLRAQKCDYFQGFLYSRPLPLDQLHVFLENEHTGKKT